MATANLNNNHVPPVFDINSFDLSRTSGSANLEGKMTSAEERGSGTSEPKRRELAEFLRSRRERLKPEQVGITQLSRRRTPGLRREEVAELAGVGTTWYTWLEQARDIQPSNEVLRRLALALKLTPVEIRHLYALAGKAAPFEMSVIEERPSEALLRTLNHSLQVPAILLGTRWDVIALNGLAEKAFPQTIEYAQARGNWIRKILVSKHTRDNLSSWETNAKRLIAEFRASISDLVDHPWVAELVESLKAESPEFASWWKDHDIRDNHPTIVEVTEDSGPLKRYERIVLHVHEGSRFKILVFNPIN